MDGYTLGWPYVLSYAGLSFFSALCPVALKNFFQNDFYPVLYADANNNLLILNLIN